jgi:hypothetical protein
MRSIEDVEENAERLTSFWQAYESALAATPREQHVAVYRRYRRLAEDFVVEDLPADYAEEFKYFLMFLDEAVEAEKLRAEIAALREARARDAAELARGQTEIAELEAALGATSAEIGAGVQRQWTRIAALMAAIRPLEDADLERFRAGIERAEQLLMRWGAQGTAVKAWRAWLVQLAARILHNDQLGVVMPSWSPWTGLAPPAGVPIVQRQ